MARIGWWRICFLAGNAHRTITRKEFLDLKSGVETLPEFAGQHWRVAHVFAICKDQVPVDIVAVEGIVWRFDRLGAVDHGVPPFDMAAFNRRLRGLRDRPTPFKTGDRWHPTPAEMAVVERVVWPGGRGATMPAREERDWVPNSPLSRAFKAVDDAAQWHELTGISQLVQLTPKVTRQIATALRLDPDAINALIAANAGDAHGARH